MVDMLWADDEGFINGVRHSLEMKGKLEVITDLDETKSEMANEYDDSNASEHDDDQYVPKEKGGSSSFFRGSSSGFANSESRISINGFNQNCLIPAHSFSAESLLAGVTYDPSSAENSHEVSLLFDGNDLSKIKSFLMITSLIELSEDLDEDASYINNGSRLLSPLVRKSRASDDQLLDKSLKEVKDTIVTQAREVTSLSLKYCKINEKGLFKLFASLRNNESLTALNLCGNVFTTDNTSASLGNLLNFNSTLQTLNVQETLMGNVGATLLSQALHINKSITSLNLSSNKIDH
jgi:hypothetical protein